MQFVSQRDPVVTESLFVGAVAVDDQMADLSRWRILFGTIDQVTTGALARGDFYWGGAASTLFWVDPIEDLWVIFLTQLMPSATFDFRGQLRNLVYSAIVD